MRDIIVWELKQRRRYILWWSLAMVLVMLMLLSIYPSIHKEADQLNQVMAQLPESIRAMRGSGDITSPIGYLNGELYYFSLPIMFIIIAIGLGAGMIGKEEQSHTLELLLSRPVSRGALITAKAIGAALTLAAIVFVQFVMVAGVGRLFGLTIDVGSLVMANVYCYLLCLSFGAIAFMMTASSIARRSSIAVATFFAFGGYLLASMSSLADWVGKLAKLFPYHYYDPYAILSGHQSKGLALYLAIIFAICAVGSYVFFRRRDIE